MAVLFENSDRYSKPIIKKRARVSTCPECSSTNIKLIIYGLPNPAKLDKNDILGGCCIDEDSPKWHCLDCNNEWGQYI